MREYYTNLSEDEKILRKKLKEKDYANNRNKNMSHVNRKTKK